MQYTSHTPAHTNAHYCTVPRLLLQRSLPVPAGSTCARRAVCTLWGGPLGRGGTRPAPAIQWMRCEAVQLLASCVTSLEADCDSCNLPSRHVHYAARAQASCNLPAAPAGRSVPPPHSVR